MSRDVFISYRRDDASEEAARLADAIRSAFGEDSVFIDTSDIRLGEEWSDVIRSALESAAVVVAVIGPGWILAQNEWGQRRVDLADDWVRQELVLALEHGKTIVPLLVRHARMAPAEALPREVAPITSRQALEIRAETWSDDVARLLRDLEQHLARRGTDTAPPAKAPGFTVDDFRAVALGFESRELGVRSRTAAEIEDVAADLDLDEILAFRRSRKTGELVAAAIALGVHIRSSSDARSDRRVLSMLGELLTSGTSSLVRYRAAEVLRSTPGLVPVYEDELRRLAKQDANASVRGMAASALVRGLVTPTRR